LQLLPGYRGVAGLMKAGFIAHRHPYWWSMIFSENRYPLFGIML